jgi:hypothetical protein
VSELSSALGDQQEVEIITRAAVDAPTHRTTIWLVVVGDRLFARTYRGPASRWYREAAAQPDCALEVAGRTYPVTVKAVLDSELWQQVSAGYQLKYAGDPSTAAMVRSEVLPTTIEFHPR